MSAKLYITLKLASPTILKTGFKFILNHEEVLKVSFIISLIARIIDNMVEVG